MLISCVCEMMNDFKQMPINESVNGTWLGRKLYIIQGVKLDKYWQADFVRKGI